MIDREKIIKHSNRIRILRYILNLVKSSAESSIKFILNLVKSSIKFIVN